MVFLFGGMELFFELSGGMGSISHVGHLGGIVFGLIYFFAIDRLHSVKWKARRLAQKIEKPLTSPSSPVRAILVKRDPYHEIKQEIIRKLNAGMGIDSLTEDEYQYVKYLDIMTDLTKPEKRFTIDVSDDTITDRQFLEDCKKVSELIIARVSAKFFADENTLPTLQKCVRRKDNDKTSILVRRNFYRGKG